MPATTHRGRDADEALPCGDGMVSAERVHEYALPFDSHSTGRISIGHTEFESTSGHTGDRGRIFSTQDARQHSHPGGVEGRLSTGGLSMVSGSALSSRTSVPSGFTPVHTDRLGDDMRSQVTGSQRSTRHSRSSSNQRSPRNLQSQTGSDSHKRVDPDDQRSNRGHRSPASDSRRSSDPTVRKQRTNAETTAGGPAVSRPLTTIQGTALTGALPAVQLKIQRSITPKRAMTARIVRLVPGIVLHTKVVRAFKGDRSPDDQRASSSRLYSASSGQQFSGQ
jgi:hypothetical protein